LHRTVTALAATLCLGPLPAFAQDADDWEFAEDAGRKLSVAAARYEGGQAVLVQCRDGELSAMIVGLPATDYPLRRVEAVRADGRRDQQSWFPEAAAPGSPAVFRTLTPGRDVRFFKGGGLMTMRSTDGDPATMEATFDLPVQSANLDRVLTACGRPLEDERDQLTRTPVTIQWEPVVSGRRDSGRGRTTGAADISCVIRNQRYTDCRVEYARPARDGARLAREMEGDRLRDPDPAAEGTVTYVGVVTSEEVIPF